MGFSILQLKPYIRRIVYALALLWATTAYYLAMRQFPTLGGALGLLTRTYGLTALFLYFGVFVPGIVESYFPKFRYNPILHTARRALGVSTFFFALLHALIAFFYNLSGSFDSFFLLSGYPLFALWFGAIALFLLLLLASTSFDVMVKRLGHPCWKMLHRLTYPAFFLVVFHALWIGSHFTNPNALEVWLLYGFALLFTVLKVGVASRQIQKSRENRPLWRTILYHTLLWLIPLGLCWYVISRLPVPGSM